MAKRLKIEELAETEEVEKLQELSKGMTTTLKNTDVPLDGKLRKYEELLAEYKQVLDDFARQQSRKFNIEKDDVKDKIDSILQKEGVTFSDKKVHFPLDRTGRKRMRKSAAAYSRKKYDETVRFLTSSHAEMPTKSMRQMAERMYPYLKNVSVNFVQYPNFSAIAKDQVARFSGRWNRL
jgi:hypothetical protein